ncbi:MAG: hypothetical protein VW665_03355, partial [Candidatus Puniceispirillum sp.]
MKQNLLKRDFAQHQAAKIEKSKVKINDTPTTKIYNASQTSLGSIDTTSMHTSNCSVRKLT